MEPGGTIESPEGTQFAFAWSKSALSLILGKDEDYED